MTDFAVDGARVKAGRITVGGVPATISTLMTRGSAGSDSGYAVSPGITSGSAFGSLADDTFYLGNQCRIVATFSGNLFVEFTGNVGQFFFSTITCSLGTFDTSSVTAYALFGGTNSRWRWDGAGTFSSSGTETIIIA